MLDAFDMKISNIYLYPLVTEKTFLFSARMEEIGKTPFGSKGILTGRVFLVEISLQAPCGCDSSWRCWLTWEHRTQEQPLFALNWAPATHWSALSSQQSTTGT